MLDIEYEFQIMEFKNRMLSAKIEMQGMIAENKQRELLNHSLAYTDKDFNNLILYYGLGMNNVPCYKG